MPSGMYMLYSHRQHQVHCSQPSEPMILNDEAIKLATVDVLLMLQLLHVHYSRSSYCMYRPDGYLSPMVVYRCVC